MKLHRRKFLRTAAHVTAGSFLLSGFACGNASSTSKDQAAEDEPMPELSPLAAFGLQLYTLRDVIGEDPKGTLRQVASFGYKQIESYEGPMGMFWGMKPGEFRSFCGDLGMEVVASHCGWDQDLERKAGEAAEAGISYLLSPWVGPQESMDDFRRIAEEFNRAGEICKASGLRFGYHNHAYSFKELEGAIPQDVLMQETDPELVDFEMDIYWVVTGGADPVEWFQRYPNRWRLCHVKDRLRSAGPEEREASCDLGTGSIDYPTILTEAALQGMEYFIVEQERYDNSTPMQSAKVDAEYLKQLKLG